MRIVRNTEKAKAQGVDRSRGCARRRFSQCFSRGVDHPDKCNVLVFSVEQMSLEVESHIRGSGWEPRYAQSAAEALSLEEENGFLVGLLILPREHHEAWLNECRKVVSGIGRVEWVVALDESQIDHEGVVRFVAGWLRYVLVLPLHAVRLSEVLGHACAMASIARFLREEGQATNDHGRFGLVGQSPVMRSLYDAIQCAANADTPVLIAGDTGTGKEQVARAIHQHSSRAPGPFVAVNCAAIPQHLLLSELVGYEKGALPDAFESKMGVFEASSGGTLVLDEIGELPLDSQAVLLRLLEDKKVTRLGGTGEARLDVRVIACVRKDLEQRVSEMTFRADLFYRLAVRKIRVPNLNERGGDINALAHHFLALAAQRTGYRKIGFSENALKGLGRYDWPGNVRELRNCVFRAIQQSSGRYVTSKDLDLAQPHSPQLIAPLRDALFETEKRTVEDALHRNSWNFSRTAKELDVSRMTLYRLAAKHGITRDKA